MASPTDLSPGARGTDRYVGIDCGGTFTDLVMANAQREVHVFKALSEPDVRDAAGNHRIHLAPGG